MEKASCCVCISIRTAGILIGISICSFFLHNLLCTIFLNEVVVYFAVNTWLYGIVSFFFLLHNFSKDKKFYLSSKPYFLSYLVCVYIAGNVWNFVFWYCMPEYLARSCKYNDVCIDRYQTYGFYSWVSITVITSYFAFVLREYKNRMFVKCDELESERIE